MPKALTTEYVKSLAEQYGDSFYLLDSDVFETDYKDLLDSFRSYYKKTNIAYSYKTNYTPKLVKIVDRLGGYAEVVSEMEMEVALRSGVAPSRIIWNGPVKNTTKVKELLLIGGTVNIDSVYEIDNIRSVAEDYPDHILNVGIRLNYEVGDGVVSRFGFDIEGEDLKTTLNFISNTPNVNLTNFQVHFAKRVPDYWRTRTEKLLEAYDRVINEYGLKPKWLDIGGGISGRMPEELRVQLKTGKYSYDDYASKAAAIFADKFGDDGPWLFIEPGTAVAANCMRYVASIRTIKSIRGKMIATTNGSQKNISMSGLNPPMEVIDGGGRRDEYTCLDIAGYTCIESDYIYKNYNGKMGIGDYIVCSCCGSYSVGMKPPFIFPNVPIIDISGDTVDLIKRAETFDDLFQTYSF